MSVGKMSGWGVGSNHQFEGWVRHVSSSTAWIKIEEVYNAAMPSHVW